MRQLQFIENPRIDRQSDRVALEAWLGPVIFSSADCREARKVISGWPDYAAMPLHRLTGAAAGTGVGEVLYKDESGRFGLKSFKALGGAYAVYNLLADAVERQIGVRPTASDLMTGRYRDLTATFTVASATAGNHGRSVAWGARMFGCRAVIFIHRGVGPSRADAIASFGARIVRVDGDYDHSVRTAAAEAGSNGWTIVSDTSYPGYTEIPRWVMCGYTVMMSEIVDQCGGRPPTHIFVPAGVGGLAAAVAAFSALTFGAERPRLIVVEPEKADCLFQSALAGEPTVAKGGLGSVLLGLDCAEVSLIAWEVLDRLADAFLLLPDEAAISAMRELNRTPADGRTIVAGECSGAGLAVVHLAGASADLRVALGLDERSRVLVFGTEGDTDPQARLALLAEPAALA